MKRYCLPMLLCSLAIAQSPPAKLSFEVASVKPGPPGTMMEVIQSGKMYVRIDDARVGMGSIPLATVIQMAYGLPPEQVVGPGWIADTRFDIQAKLPEGASKEQVPAMLQTLLLDRFKLAVHHDQKVAPVYVMTVGKDGPKFHESTTEDHDGAGACNGGLHKVCRKVTMENLANLLSRPSRQGGAMASVPWAIDRPVVDMTGLKGTYDFTMDYGNSGLGGRGGGGVGDAPATPMDSGVITAFDAVKALGLKLEPAKHTYDILVIDHVEKVPTEN